jgi:hypothetical protein
MIQPQKLLLAGSECFLESMENNDSDYVHYYYNALKAQYLIEDTIMSIQSIKPCSDPTIMICDNNPMDVRLMNEADVLWYEALERHNVEMEICRFPRRR